MVFLYSICEGCFVPGTERVTQGAQSGAEAGREGDNPWIRKPVFNITI